MKKMDDIKTIYAVHVDHGSSDRILQKRLRMQVEQ